MGFAVRGVSLVLALGSTEPKHRPGRDCDIPQDASSPIFKIRVSCPAGGISMRLNRAKRVPGPAQCPPEMEYRSFLVMIILLLLYTQLKLTNLDLSERAVNGWKVHIKK